MEIKDWFINGTKRTILCVIVSGIALILSLTGSFKNVLPFDIAWTAIMAGIGNATKFGILIRSGDALERLSNVQYIAFADR